MDDDHMQELDEALGKDNTKEHVNERLLLAITPDA
jgi:hypothetical protein